MATQFVSVFSEQVRENVHEADLLSCRLWSLGFPQAHAGEIMQPSVKNGESARSQRYPSVKYSCKAISNMIQVVPFRVPNPFESIFLKPW